MLDGSEDLSGASVRHLDLVFLSSVSWLRMNGGQRSGVTSTGSSKSLAKLNKVSVRRCQPCNRTAVVVVVVVWVVVRETNVELEVPNLKSPSELPFV